MNTPSFDFIENNTNQVLLTFLKAVNDAIILTTANGIILYTNNAIELIINGVEPKTLEGKNIFNIFHFPSPLSTKKEQLNYLQHSSISGQIICPTWLDPYTDNEEINLTINSISTEGVEKFIFIIRPKFSNTIPILPETKSTYPTTENKITNKEDESQNQPSQPQYLSTKKLQLLLKKEKELNRIKSKFISIASHEFRTPLSTILASADLIGRYAQQVGESRYDRHVNRIKASIRNLTKVLENFLSLDKLEEGVEINQPREVHFLPVLNKIIEEAQTTLRPAQHIDLQLDMTSEMICIDPRILRIILINLLNNASKYSKIDMRIDLHIKETDEELYIQVKDQGIGIPETDQPHIFTRFYRGQNTVSTGGAGLGLNVIQQYLKLINGNIKFSTIINKGTTFEVWYPIQSSK